jgi:phytoene desaturase
VVKTNQVLISFGNESTKYRGLQTGKKVLVIGSGAAGLAASIRLAQAGYAVVVFEANNYPGGKITTVEGKGYRFDAGPSLFTLPELVTELFALCGEHPEDHFTFYKKEVACHYFWQDGETLIAPTDPIRFARAVSETFKVKEKVLKNYLKDAAKVYDATHHLFLESSLHQLKTYFHPDVLKALTYIHKLHLLSTLHEVNKQKLKHRKLVQLFDRFATYNGSSPYKTPAVMSIIPHLEHNLGSYYPKGGMHSITTSLHALAERMEVQFHFGERVEHILLEGNEVSGVVTNKGTYTADLVFSNMDVVPTYRKLLPYSKAPEKILRQKRSSSALIFYWGVRHTFPQLDLHNIFFSRDYESEFKAIFEEETVCEDPTIYVNISSKEDAGDAPEGCENWFVMVNVPANTGQDWDALITRLRARILEHLSKRLEVDLEPLIEFEETLDPRSIERKTSSYQGALYGAASNNAMAAFLRHPNLSPQYKNLYFCGGSVHPGGGVPLALLSAKIAVGMVK